VPSPVSTNGCVSMALVWTGSDSNGVKVGTYCSDWGSGSSTPNGTGGEFDVTNAAWSNYCSPTCNRTLHLYCLEQ
jgi:hypothetical protein